MSRGPRPPRIVLLWVGRSGDSPFEEACEDYVRRVDRFLPAAIRRVRPAGGDDPRAVAEESRRLLEAVGSPACLWLCDREGKEVDSPGLARWLDADLASRPAPLVVSVGGAAGVDDTFRARADRRVSFGRVTLPHAIARLVAAEQLFRALTLREGVPYHK